MPAPGPQGAERVVIDKERGVLGHHQRHTIDDEPAADRRNERVDANDRNRIPFASPNSRPTAIAAAKAIHGHGSGPT